MANVYSSGIGESVQGVPIDNARRVFDFGDRISELAPLESPFFVYLSQVAKVPTNDPVFKFLERRHQWQRRDFAVESNKAAAALGATISGLKLGCKYDKYGRTSATYVAPLFLLVGQMVQVRAGVGPSGGPYTPRVLTARVTALGSANATSQAVDLAVHAIDGDTGWATTYASAHIKFDADAPGQVIGSAFAEGTGAPNGWMDSLFTREGYTQIFKTAIPLFSGSTLATEYRGIQNEYNRVWTEKLMEHKMDIEHTMLFGVGRYEAENGTDPKRYSWGIVPYTERFGKVYPFSYNNSNYDTFIDTMKDFFAPESGNSRNKLVLASRKVLAWLQKLQGDGFLKNSVGTQNYRMDVQNIQGTFGHEVTRVRTIFGNLHFLEEPLFRGLYEDYCIAIDLKNVKYRPLVGNGISRDTHVVTNIQNNDTDGRIDQILTEAGLEIDLPETHAVLKWS